MEFRRVPCRSRIPNVQELFGGVSEGGLTSIDPCSGWASLPSSSVGNQNCQASGVPAGYTQLGKAIQTTVGGNPNLEPEDAETLTVGAVWTPTFAEGLTLTFDYFNIKIDNAIQRIDGSTKLAVCYNTPGLAQTGRASGREIVCKYVQILVVAGYLKK